MIVEVPNSSLYPKWLNHLISDEAKEALQLLIGIAATTQNYNCQIQWKGENGPIKDFRFYDQAGDQRFSFITNKGWLLFYFRLPAVRSGEYEADQLGTLFKTFNVNTRGEWTVKLTNIRDVRNLSKVIVW